MLGVLGAMTVEVEAVRAALSQPVTRRLLGYDVTSGRLDGVPVLVAESGVGKVNAALATTALVEAGATAIVFTGMAGGLTPGVHIGDAVVDTDLVQHDVDVTRLGEPLGRLPREPAAWPADPDVATALVRALGAVGAHVHRGRIASGDQFIAAAAQARRIAAGFGALAVEMEGAAAAQAAAKLGCPFAVLRWISDAADEAAPADFPAFCQHIADLDLGVVRALVTQAW